MPTATYRVITKHVRYWRGNIHRWTNSYSLIGTAAAPSAADLTTLTTAESKLLYSSTAVTGTGGCWGAAAYATGGGIPLSEVSYFDPDSPGTWIAYNSSGWPSRTALTEPQAEVAMLVEWPAGLSSSGKPVTFRKWYHAVPSSLPASVGAPDIPAATVTSLTADAVLLTNCLAASNLLFGNARRYAGTPVVQNYYANHQMPRGRRRKALVTASGRYTGPTINGEPIVPVEN